jgi:hypothetical protein
LSKDDKVPGGKLGGQMSNYLRSWGPPRMRTQAGCLRHCRDDNPDLGVRLTHSA